MQSWITPRGRMVALAFLALSLGACKPSDQGHPANGSGTTATNAPAVTPATGETPLTTGPTAAASDTSASALRVEVDLSTRKLQLLRGSERVATYDVAVGSAKWPTQTGEWRITQVVFNPDWIPPDESWAEEREPRESGDPKNPLGRVQLVYDPPRTIHGTNQPSSIGTATSHGSIRMRNAEIEQLARQLMESAGVPKDEAFFTRAKENRTKKEIVDLPQPVAIRVK